MANRLNRIRADFYSALPTPPDMRVRPGGGARRLVPAADP